MSGTLINQRPLIPQISFCQKEKRLFLSTIIRVDIFQTFLCRHIPKRLNEKGHLACQLILIHISFDAL